MVDRLTKFGHFIPLSHPFTAVQVAQVFLDNVYKLHGLPESIITDRDRVFTSGFWQELFRMAGTELHYSSSYHPETDGQSERLNQCLETYLRCMTSESPTQWSHWLSLAELWYNTAYHTSLGVSPFEALYGHKPLPLPLGPYHDTLIPAAHDMLQTRAQMLHRIKEHLHQAQNRMKTFADKHMTERQFVVGDWVFLKLQPYRQQMVALKKNLKLTAKFFGLFQIVEKIGVVAYKLKLPPGLRCI